MHHLLRIFLLLSSILVLGTSQARTVEDMLGRKVDIPDRIERVFGAAPPTSVLLYTLAPDTLIALNMPFPAGSEGSVPPRLLSLPVLGSTMGHGREANMEELLRLKPDLAIAWGGRLPPGADSERIAAQYAKIGVPVLFVRLDTLDDWPRAYTFIGKVLGREQRAGQLADYVLQAQARVSDALLGVPESDKPVVYYAEGAGGLATECDSSFHVEPLVMAGARLPYHCAPSSVMGMEAVSLEQVISWNPDYIIAAERGLPRRIADDPRWQDIKAVRQARILGVPAIPFNWLDRPPSVTRALGIQWLANALYPRRFPLDLKAETLRFYQLFLDYTPDDAALARMLADQAGVPAEMPAHHH